MPAFFDADKHFIERHDPNPSRLLPPEWRQREEAETQRQKLLIAAP